MDDEAVAIAERAAGMAGVAALCALANETSEWFLEGEINLVEGNMQGSGKRVGRCEANIGGRQDGAQAHRRGFARNIGSTFSSRPNCTD